MSESDGRYRQLIELSPDALLVHCDGVFVYANPAALDLLGATSAEQIVGRQAIEMVHPDDRQYIGERRDHVLGRDGPVEIRQIRFLRLDGSHFYSEGKTAENDLIAAKMEAERAALRAEEAMRAAHAANRAKSEFLAAMSHEVRTPMNGVLGMAGVLLDTEFTDQQRQFVDTIRQSGEALLDILNDIFDFSKIEAGKLELEVMDFDLHNAVEGVPELLAPKAHGKGIELAMYVSPNVPHTVRGDPGRLRQILLNLLPNAIKCTDEGAATVKVDVEAADDREVLRRLRVSDTGIGIFAAAQETLFERFTQADATTTRQFGGTGLGVAICKQLAELMRGDIGVESAPGRGSTFWVDVRLGVAAAAGDEPAGERIETFRGRRILLANGNRTTRRILEKQLDRFGMEVTSADDAKSARAQLAAAAERAGRRRRPENRRPRPAARPARRGRASCWRRTTTSISGWSPPCCARRATASTWSTTASRRSTPRVGSLTTSS